VASWGRVYFTRARITTEAQTWAEELAHDIAEDLKGVEPDAADRDLEEKLLGYLNRHSRVVGLDLYFYCDASTASRIVAPRADRSEIPRFAPCNRRPLGFAKRQAAGEAQERPIEIPVDLKGPWKATLVMKWAVRSIPPARICSAAVGEGSGGKSHPP